MVRIVTAAALGALAASAATAQQALWQQYGEVRNERFGQSVAWLDDLDGDGVRDFAAGAPAWDPPFVARHGIVRICSGFDGSLLKELRDDDRHSFGWRVADAGDLDSDGHDDVLVGAPNDGDGFVFAFGSVSGTKLWEFTGGTSSQPASRYGHGLVALGDLDGDGVRDFAVGSPDHSVGANRVGLVEFHSGATGALLRSRTGGADSSFGDGRTIDAAGDLDGDGRGDLLAVEMLLVPIGSPNCSLDVWSGATFTSVRHVVLTLPTSLGTSFHLPTARAAGDVDGDGVVDFVVSMDSRGPGPSARALLVSGATGATIRTIVGVLNTFGERCGGVGDVDGDGLAEVAVTKDILRYGYGHLELYKGSDGSLLRTIFADAYASHAFATSFDATVDADGDGIHDLLVGSPPYYDPPTGWFGGPGRAQRRSLLDGSTVFARDGVNVERYFTSAAVVVDDVDGDGLLDVVMAATDQSKVVRQDWLSLRSGADGREIAASPPPRDDFRGEMVAIPDVDGDGLADLAVAPNDNTAARVEVRSGATLALIRKLTLVSAGSIGLVLAAGVQPATGNVEVCVGSPQVGSASGGVYVGRATLFDAVTGVKRWELTGNSAYAYEQFGAAIALVGDLDGDGWSDWAVGAPGNGKNGADCGCVRFLSGNNGTVVQSLFGVASGDVLGSKLGALPDSGGDGVSELLVKSYRFNAGGNGQLDLLDSATWTPIATLQGAGALDDYPDWIVAPLPDANGDGFADFAVGASSSATPSNFYELRSGLDARLLHRRILRPGEYDLGWRAAGPPPGRTGVRRKGGGPVAVAWDTYNSVYGATTGLIELTEFDDLYLEIDPPSAPAGATVEAWVRGGPAGALAAVMLDSINGLPAGVMVAVSLLDANGELALDAVIPPGLSGDEWSLLGFAIGWNGKLVVSQSAQFAFE